MEITAQVLKQWFLVFATWDSGFEEIEMRWKKLLGVGLGSSLEWYDFALYGFFAPVFAKQFFPPADPQANLIESFGVFAIGFLVRPLGGLIFGRLGDKYGRINCLKITPLLITIPTLCIAFLPTYAEIGIWASVLLLITRVVQGIFIGGEYAGNMVYMCESSLNKRYLYGSLASCTGSFGIFLASLMSSMVYEIFSKDFALTYGWRIAFSFSLILGIVAFLLRRNIPETPEFERIKRDKTLSKSPILDALKLDWYPCVIALSLLFLHATTFYAIFTFMPTLISETHAFVPGMALKYISVILFVRLFVLPMIGWAAGKVGGKIMMQISSFLFMILSYFLFSFVAGGKSPDAVIAIAVFALLSSLNAGTIPGLLTEILPTRTRYTTFSFTLNAGFGIFGGIAPMVLQFIITNTEDHKNAAVYLVFSASVAFIGTFFINGLLKNHRLSGLAINELTAKSTPI